MDILGALRNLQGQHAPGQGIDPRMGGAPGLTISLKKQFDDYAMQAMANGEQPTEWADWLQQQGYQLGPDMQVRPMGGGAGLPVGTSLPR